MATSQSKHPLPHMMPGAQEQRSTFVSVAQISFDDEEDLSNNPVDSESKHAMTKGRVTSTKSQRSSKIAAQLAISTNPSNGSTTNLSSTSQLASASDQAAAARRNPLRNPVKRSQPLDFRTLRTSAPRHLPPRPNERLFGLEHAPVYYPTIEEFASPTDYIDKIASEAKLAGICKIIPPQGWTPPFALETETFRFKTRLQQLNSMEASARASINFLEQLHMFHEQQGNGPIILPVLSGKPVDLWKLRKEVNAIGGYNQVTADRQWNGVAKSMGYDVRINSSICSTLKSAYSRLIVPFEHYINKTQMTDEEILNHLPSTSSAFSKSDPALPNTPKDTTGADSLATPNTSDEIHNARRTTLVETNDHVRTASDKLNEALNASADSAVASGSGPTQNRKADEIPGDSCEICSMDHNPEQIVLCDGCDRGFHLNCLSPPLLEVPRSNFSCVGCLLMEGADYGFEEGQEHSLHSFRRRADAFKSNWLAEHPLPVDHKGKGKESARLNPEEEMVKEQIAYEDHFEREFWRLVESPFEGVEVEYGADVDAAKDGGAFPNLEVHPNDPYSRDGWNLNNLPILAGSLLRYIKSDISGMTIPWMYVGMCFSTFAWHKEDHYTYSINYHHFGDTKTWYGIPGEDDEKLEETMKLAAPELLAQQPDLLFQLVTLMSPGRLKENGVRVVACDQRPREFVVTFPRAYHSGFNHGFNFNEAVNFALADWLPTGLKCVNRYQDIRKNPVFSHDELLVTISNHEKSTATSQWLYPSWLEMVTRELDSRTKIRALLPGLVEVVDDTDLDEEEYQCSSCKILCYLAQVTTISSTPSSSSSSSASTPPTPSKIACADHFTTLDPGPKTMKLRFSDAELLAILARVRSRAEKVGDRRASSSHKSMTKRMRTSSIVAIDQEEALVHIDQKPKYDVDSVAPVPVPSSTNGGARLWAFAPPPPMASPAPLTLPAEDEYTRIDATLPTNPDLYKMVKCCKNKKICADAASFWAHFVKMHPERFKKISVRYGSRELRIICRHVVNQFGNNAALVESLAAYGWNSVKTADGQPSRG